MRTGLSRTDPYLSVENNIRVRDDEVVLCARCGDEAVVIANDGTDAMCQPCYDRYEERLRLMQEMPA